MYVAEIICPGTWLKLPDPQIKREVEIMLSNMKDRVAEAAITLTMFEKAYSEQFLGSNDEWDRDRKIRSEVSELVRQEAGELYAQEHKCYSLECDRRVLKRNIELGIMPRSYGQKIPFIHAHSFIYAVDSFAKFFEELCNYPNLPGAVTALRDSFDAELPTVRKIRNSAMHIEDRSRGYGTPGEKRKGIRMQVEGFLGMGNLEENQLGYTIDDGAYQRVAISVDTLDTMTRILNQLLNLFEWEGSPRVSPS